MTDANPYRAPSAELADVADASELELAGLGHRFGAAVIDQLIAAALVLPLGYLAGLTDFTGKHPEPTGASILMAMLDFALFALVQSYFLARNGQTIGKRIVGIRIVDLDGNKPRLLRLLGIRYGIVYLFASLPAIGMLAWLGDVLFIFRRDRRCIHDLVAGTRVILSGARHSSLTWFVRPIVLLLVLAVGAIVIAAVVQYQTAKSLYERPAPAPSATPAPAPATRARAATDDDPAQGAAAAAPPAADSPAPAVPQAPAPPQPSDAELRRCLALKDAAAVIRCSQGGK